MLVKSHLLTVHHWNVVGIDHYSVTFIGTCVVKSQRQLRTQRRGATLALTAIARDAGIDLREKLPSFWDAMFSSVTGVSGNVNFFQVLMFCWQNSHWRLCTLSAADWLTLVLCVCDICWSDCFDLFALKIHCWKSVMLAMLKNWSAVCRCSRLLYLQCILHCIHRYFSLIYYVRQGRYVMPGICY